MFFETLSWVICSQPVGNGELHQAAKRFEPVTLRERLAFHDALADRFFMQQDEGLHAVVLAELFEDRSPHLLGYRAQHRK